VSPADPAQEVDAPAVRAGGGIVRRRVRPGWLRRRVVEIVVIHRPRYDDWSFPKGKVDDGETVEEAARREVHEETGMPCRILAPLGETHYADRRGRPKVVRYWLMEPEDGAADAPFEPNAEVDGLRWLPRDEAARLLTYPHDRELLNRVPWGSRPT
jgi:8-oxo-dGTP pyrophosphatase MutT (NUDIX family)